MRAIRRIPCLAFIITTMSLSCFGQRSESNGKHQYPDPARFEAEIRHFENVDRKQPPPPGAIVCVGSSSMRHWHQTIREDLAPLTVIPRGFGGSNMNDLLYYSDRIVLCYRPRAIVVYEGDNDIAQGITPEKITETFDAFVRKVHKGLPACRIYFLSIKPSIARWKLWPEMKEANHLIALKCAGDKRLTFVDVSSGMLDDAGKPRKDIFLNDYLHMNRKGYVIWRNALRPILIKNESPFEPTSVLSVPEKIMQGNHMLCGPHFI